MIVDKKPHEALPKAFHTLCHRLITFALTIIPPVLVTWPVLLDK